MLDSACRRYPAAVVSIDDAGRGVAAANHALLYAAALVGREREIESLTGRLAPAGGLRLIEGMAGVGKTLLALHAAHRLTSRFPDAQFFVDLHAHSPFMRAVAPADALHQLLTADGVPPSQIAPGVEGRAAQWRSRLAGRRCLVVLDNALERRQVAPLLPAGGDCLVLVTSRRRLTGLSAQHSAAPLELGTLTEEHAAELFAQRSGRSRRGADADAITAIVRICGLLPLPICLLAAKLHAQPRRRAADLLRELRQAAHPTARMKAEDLAVGRAFDLSFRQLPKGRRRFLRRLAVHPGEDVDVAAAAALTGITIDVARAHLEALFHEHLVDQHPDGRYHLHDLIGDHARSRGMGEGARVAAICRLAAHYELCARDAARALAVPSGSPDVSDRLRARADALLWFQRQRTNLLACTTALALAGQHRRLTALAGALAPFLREAGPWEHAITVHRSAAECAARHGEDLGQAAALRDLGVVLYLRSEYTEAVAALRGALVLLRGRTGGDAERAEEAAVLTRLGAAQRQAGRLSDAITDLEDALRLLRHIGDRVGEAEALAELGMVRIRLAQHDRAVSALREALAIQQAHGSMQSCAQTLNRLGAALQSGCDHAAAIVVHEQALALCRTLNDLKGTVDAHNYLGHLLCETGEYTRAAQVLAEGLALHDELGSRVGMANALVYLGTAYRELGQFEEADEATRRALGLYRRLGVEAGYADSLNKLGIIRRLSGDLDAADEAHREALDVFARLADPLGQAEVLNAQGELECSRGRTDRALSRHRAALGLAARAGNDTEQARAERGIGRCRITAA